MSRAVERHPHLADPVPDGWVRVDCHSHTMWSGDCTTTPEELAAAVADAGIEVLCITDHHAVAGAQRLAGEFDARVIVGEEVRTHAGELIGLFLSERVPQGLSPRDCARRIREQGGLVYVPHPFDPMRRCLDATVLHELVEEGWVDAIEVRNAKTSLEHLNRQAAELAESAGLAGGGGSDAHVPGAIGAAYALVPDFSSPAEFLASLAAGRVVGHHWDEPRPWTPRIVPSI